MLKIEQLTAGVADKVILRDINLEVPEGEVHALFGPNGCGKSTLMSTIMGLANYTVFEGRIWFRGEDITYASVDERARLGLGMSFQNPPQVTGVVTRDFITRLLGEDGELVEALAAKVNMGDMLDRELNVGLSGGERKRSELLQLLAQQPSMILLDEPESGVDLVNIELVGSTISELLQRKKHRQKERSGLVITHTGLILNYLNADRGWVMLEGQIRCCGNPREIFEKIRLAKLRHGDTDGWPWGGSGSLCGCCRGFWGVGGGRLRLGSCGFSFCSAWFRGGFCRYPGGCFRSFRYADRVRHQSGLRGIGKDQSDVGTHDFLTA